MLARTLMSPPLPKLLSNAHHAELLAWRNNGESRLALVARIAVSLQPSGAVVAPKTPLFPFDAVPFKVASDVVVVGMGCGDSARVGELEMAGDEQAGWRSRDERAKQLPPQLVAADVETVRDAWEDGLDPRYWSVAPEDRRLARQIAVDEPIEVRRQGASWRARLPGVRCLAVTENATGLVAAVPLRADLLYLDVARRQAVVEWRGSVPADALRVFVTQHSGAAPALDRIRDMAAASDEVMQAAYETQVGPRSKAAPALPFRGRNAPPPLIQPAPPPASLWGGARPPSPLVSAPAPVALAVPREAPAPVAAADPAGDEVAVDLCWYDGDAEPLLRQAPGLAPRDAELLDDFLDDSLAHGVTTPLERRVRTLLYEAPRTRMGELRAAYLAASDRAALVCVEATVVPSLCPRTRLERMVDLAALHPSDARLSETLQASREALRLSWLPDDTARSLTDRLAEDCARAARREEAELLLRRVERRLVEERAYVIHPLFGGRHVCGLLRGDDTCIPLYLPAAVSGHLPLADMFRARLLLSLQLRRDEREAQPIAAVALAVGLVARAAELERAG